MNFALTMKTHLTPQLLGFLIERGFTYCLSKTLINPDNNSCEIILTPTKEKPDAKNLLPGYDNWYKITREPFQMAGGMDDAEVYLNLDF